MLPSNTWLDNRYRIKSPIGGGGQAVVYLAEDHRLSGQECAIKELSPTQLSPEDLNWAIPAFQQEAQILARLSHAGIVRVSNYFEERGNWYLVMDYVPGQTLGKWLEQQPGGLPLQVALNYGVQLCAVLEYLHAQSPAVIFRDLKPDNIMVTPSGELKLIDFGIARFFKSGQGHNTVNLGTPGYASPEHGGKGQTDARSDIYSLGVLLHQMVTGYDPTTTPFTLPPARSLNATVPPTVEEAIKRATQLQPAQRYQTAAKFRQALTQRVSPPPPPAPSSGIPKWVYALAGVVAIALIVGVVFSVSSTPSSTPPATLTAPAASPRIMESVPPSITSPPTYTPFPSPTPSLTAVAVVPGKIENRCQEEYTGAKRIAFARGQTNNSSIYISYDAHSATELIKAGDGSSEPNISPDGNQIVFQVRSGNVNLLYLVNVKTGTTTQLTSSNDGARDAHWSPDGCQIVYVTGNTAEGGELRVIDLSSRTEKSLNLFGRAPVWSPDGSRLAYMSDVGGWRIFIVDLASGSSLQLPCSRAHCRFPRWSPDGATIAYNSIEPGYTPNGLWVVSSDGQNNRQLTSDRDGRPDWWDANTLIFNRGDPSQLCLIEIGSGAVNCIINTGGNDWAPNIIGK